MCRFLDNCKSTLDELVKGLTDVAAIGRRCLKVTQTILVCVILDTLGLDLPHLGEIRLVPNQHDGDPCIRIVLKFPQPLLHVFKGLTLGNIECNNGPNSSPIVCIGDGPETLLTSSIPDLILDRFALNKCGLRRKLNSNSGLRVHIEGIVHKARKKVRLSNPRISNHNYLKQEIELLLPTHTSII